MSERGQKIFKWIVWIVIAALFAVRILNLAATIKDAGSLISEGPITREEWMMQLSDGFGDPSIVSSVKDGGNPATGEYAAITAMDAIGEDRLAYLTEEEITAQTKLNLALQYGVIEEKELDKNISSETANEIIVKALDLYCSPDYYPEYFEVETKTDVVNADRWNISEYNEESQIITATISGDAPEVGEVIMFTNEYGIAQARYVSKVNDNGAGVYTIQVSNVEDVSEIFDEISFSGTSDFDYLVGNKTPGQDEYESGEVQEEARGFNNPFVVTTYAAESEPLLLAEREWFEDKTALKKETNGEDTKKCDIEFNVEISDTVKSGKETGKVTSYISVKADGITKKYKYSIDDSGKESFTVDVSEDGLPSFAFSENDKKAKSNDTSYIKDEMGVKANIKMTGFGVCTSGYYQWADPDDSKNFVEVLASAEKVNISSAAKLSFEDKYKIGSIPIPIAATAGVISIDLNVYLVVGADGELTLWYEIDDPYVGVNVSTANGFKPLHGCSKEDAGVRAKIELNGGFIGEAAVMVLETVDLADPGADIRAYASASTIDVKDTYKLKDDYLGTTCIELKAQAPVVKLSASAGQDSLLYSLLDTLKVDASYDLIKKDSDNRFLKKLTYHVEYEDDGTVTVTKLEEGKKHEDVCTHIEKKTKIELEAEGIKDDIEDEIDKKVNEAEEAAKRRIEKMIEDAIEKWFEENCGGC